MQVGNKIVFFMTLFLIAHLGVAGGGKDPIGWNVSGNIPSATVLYKSYIINYHFTNNGINISVPLTIHLQPSTNEFIVTNGCAQYALSVGASCDVSIKLVPKSLGKKSLKWSVSYGYNSVNLPTIETNTNENSDPILWQQTESIPAETITSNQYKTIYLIRSNLPYHMEAPLSVAHQASSDEFILADGCTGQQLAPGGQCSLEVTYAPKMAGLKTLNMSVTYGNFVLSLPVLETQTVSHGKPDVHVKLLKELPPFTRIGGSYEVTAEFSNSGTAEATNLAFNNNYPKGFTESDNKCSDIMPAGSSCIIRGVYVSSSVENAAVSFSLNYAGGNVSVATSTKGVDPGLGRIISFVNKCDHDVWLGIHGGAADDICVNDSDCPTGSTCKPDSDDGVGVCFWSNPIPAFPRGEYLLKANEGKNYVKVFDVDPEQDVIWSGELAGRTGCVGASCETADCHSEGGDHECPMGVDFNKPATVAKMSLLRHRGDLYSIDASHGVSLPLSIAPTNVAANKAQPYICGVPGAMTPSHPALAACSWSFVPPSADYVNVYATGKNICASDDDCTDGDVCGLHYDPLQKPVLQKLCGKKIGYWTANEACSKSAEAAQPYFQCNKELGSSGASYALAALYSCAAPNKHDALLNSCYAYKNNSCCGCVNWDQLGIAVPGAPHTDTCLAQNPDWIGNVLPGVQWLKQACPTMSVYPHDEKSSTFQCSTADAGDNHADYTITFCPQ